MRVLSWNILADAYIKPEFFPRADPAILMPGARQALILEQIGQHDADLVALQEVEAIFAQEFTRMYEYRYDVIFMCSPGKPAGILLAVDKKHDVSKVYQLHLTCDTLLVSVETKVGSFVVVNAHLKWAPARTDPRAHPGVVQAAGIKRFLHEFFPGVNVLLCSDTNDLPGGVVRSELDFLRELQADGSTSLFDGCEPRALDVIMANADALGHGHDLGDTAWALPSAKCPSDHLPVVVDVL